MWEMLVSGMEAILRFLYEISISMGIPSYGIAIILLTLIIKIVLYPLSHKQLVSVKKMQDIQPQMKEIQEKHKNSPEKANKAILELYKKNKINPMAGCLPLLIQMPILIALFQALRRFQYADLGASFLWIPHLNNPDPYMILPVLVAVATYAQSRITMLVKNDDNTQVAATQKTMLYLMPIMIGWMSNNLPAGLGLYWVFFSLFGAIQQIIVNRQPTMQKGEV